MPVSEEPKGDHFHSLSILAVAKPDNENRSAATPFYYAATVTNNPFSEMYSKPHLDPESCSWLALDISLQV